VKTTNEIENQPWRFLRGLRHIEKAFPLVVRAATLAAAILWLPSVGGAGDVVANCREADLRAAMAGAGTLTFAGNGTITLSSPITAAMDTVLDARGHQVTISCHPVEPEFNPGKGGEWRRAT
jgi:hypothetical protein